MGRIMVAVDGSEAAKRAAQMAVDLASKTGDELVLCHVCVPIVYPAETAWVRSPEIDAAQREQGQALVTKLASELSQKGVQPRALVLEGPAAESLLERAEADNVSMLVVGSRGRNALARVLLGSVADRLVHLSKRPVLVVH